MTVKTTIKYEAGHSYDEEWESLWWHCPLCGQQEVWHELGAGDYYVGEVYLCRKCGAHFYLPNGVNVRDKDWQDQQRLRALRDQSPGETSTSGVSVSDK